MRKLGRRYDSHCERIGRKDKFVTIQKLMIWIEFTDYEINRVLDLKVGESIRWPKDGISVHRVR